ncbi:hypothetical protein BASA81_005400 [Batrachochytrium salamandrivorans]|nr:hypothetical protein BASA81_005400 [Batrachochytrium salamandrivorans]
MLHFRRGFALKRKPMSSQLSQEIEDLHNLAVSKGQSTHCPYGHFNVKSENRCTKLPDKAVLLKATNPIPGTVGPSRVLFWSGGKDSFLALQALERENAQVTLLTSFEPNAGVVPEQDIPMSVIFDQAKHLQRDLIAVPNTGEYVASLLKGLALLGGENPRWCLGICI